MIDSGEKDWKLIATIGYGVAGKEILTELRKNVISHFFDHYKDLESEEKWTDVSEGWATRDEMWSEILSCQARFGSH